MQWFGWIDVRVRVCVGVWNTKPRMIRKFHELCLSFSILSFDGDDNDDDRVDRDENNEKIFRV